MTIRRSVGFACVYGHVASSGRLWGAGKRSNYRTWVTISHQKADVDPLKLTDRFCATRFWIGK